MFRRGEFLPLKKWLNEHIHQHGQRWRAGELCERVTGKPLSHEPLMRYLRGKYAPLYGLNGAGNGKNGKPKAKNRK
jgi:carboxypeptidase Taq